MTDHTNFSGFGLTEFLIAMLVLLVAMASLFGIAAEVQSKAGYQTEVQAVLDNTRLAMLTIGRYLRQAGNDPLQAGFSAITIISPNEVRIQSDITGSAGPSDPDKGDPDGDISDSGESVTIRYNSTTKSLEIVPEGGSAQIVAGYISGLSFRYYDAEDMPVSAGGDIYRVTVTISGRSLYPDPRTHRFFGMELRSDFHLPT